MRNFDIHDFMYQQLLKEVGEEEVPQAQTDAAPQAPVDPKTQEQAPATQPPTVQTPFDKFSGSTIKNIKLNKHENGGSVTIYTSLGQLPLVISWTGDQVTVKYKDIVSV